MQTTQERTRSNSLRGFRYHIEELDHDRKPKDVDALTKGQNAKAAQLLMELYYEQERNRNMSKVVADYSRYKNGNYGVDVTNAGRPAREEPPPEWPFDVSEWNRATNNPQAMLCKAAAYTLHERERLMRQHEKLFDQGVDALDPVQSERLQKTKKKANAISRRNWRERMKVGQDGALVGENPVNIVYTSGQAASPTPYVSSSDPYADVASQIIGNYFDEVVEVNP